MDTGRISARYAKAVYEYALKQGEETRLYEEMKTLSGSYISFPSMRRAMEDPTVLPEEKINVLTTAAGIRVCETCKRLIRVVIENGRESYMQTIALMYQEYFRREKNILIVKLTAVEPVSDTIKGKLRQLIVENTHEEVDFVAQSDPDMIGGFILELDNKRLDASVRNQLNQLRLQLVE